MNNLATRKRKEKKPGTVPKEQYRRTTDERQIIGSHRATTDLPYLATLGSGTRWLHLLLLLLHSAAVISATGRGRFQFQLQNISFAPLTARWAERCQRSRRVSPAFVAIGKGQSAGRPG